MLPIASRTLLAAACVVFGGVDAYAAPKTVCTITVNSPDERDVFQRSLPESEYSFVELVERGRADWLATACRKGVQCDVLLISGHFDGGTEFYTDRLDAGEFLPVDEMERVACGQSCPGLFSQLKEVYLFGCNTLHPQPMRSISAEIVRGLIRSGHAPADAERLAQVLNDRHGESNRDRMRHIFKDVPVIYGFSSKAPLGRSAGPLLERYFQRTGSAEVGNGQPSAKLLALFGPSSMTYAAGMTDSDPRAGFRRDACHFTDDVLPLARKLGALHALLQREAPEARMFLDLIEKHWASIESQARDASADEAFAAIANDALARGRWLDFARDADDPSVEMRMMTLASRFGWLNAEQRRDETLRMIAHRFANGPVVAADVDLVCTLNREGQLGHDRYRSHLSSTQAAEVPHAAILACLGSGEDRAQVLRALTGSRDGNIEIAQVYLRHHPIVDLTELRIAVAGVARMPTPDAQVRALQTIASHRLSDRESLESLTQLFPATRSVEVQRAIAGILIRSDYEAIEKLALARSLRQHRVRSPDGHDLIDVLIRRLQVP